MAGCVAGAGADEEGCGGRGGRSRSPGRGVLSKMMSPSSCEEDGSSSPSPMMLNLAAAGVVLEPLCCCCSCCFSCRAACLARAAARFLRAEISFQNLGTVATSTSYVGHTCQPTAVPDPVTATIAWHHCPATREAFPSSLVERSLSA